MTKTSREFTIATTTNAFIDMGFALLATAALIQIATLFTN